MSREIPAVPRFQPDPATPYGFAWGPIEVTRCCMLPVDRRIVQVKSAYRTLDVYVSATGRSIRVFSAGKEWTP